MLFEGNRAGVEPYLRSITGQYYVYVLCRPDGRPFYVGKGINKRALDHEAEARRNHPIGESNPFKCNVIRKIVRDGGEIIYRIDATFSALCQQDCLECESSLIKLHRRLHEGGSLTNLAGGIGNLSGAAPFSLERHASTLSGAPDDNPERAALNRFLQGIGPVASVPVKPIDQIARILPSTPHPQRRSPTQRSAYALVASASAMGLQLQAGVRLPRSFTYQGVEAIIENGVARDILKSGMASVVAASNPALEIFELSSRQVDCIVELVGLSRLNHLGLS